MLNFLLRPHWLLAFFLLYACLPTAPQAQTQAVDKQQWWQSLDESWRKFFSTKMGLEQAAPTPAQLDSIFAIKKLDCRGAGLTTLVPLAALQNLEVLWCDQNGDITDLEPLRNLNLKELDCSTTGVKHLGPLRSQENLEKLIFYDCPVESLAPLHGLRKLTFIDCSGTLITSLDPLKYVTSLEVIYFARCMFVDDISPLGALKNLSGLTFSETKVADLSPLSEHEKLTEMVFASTKVSDIQPLAKSANLAIIYAAGSPVTEEQAKMFNKKVPNCAVLIE